MGYSKDIYTEAENVMRTRRMDALRAADDRKEKFYAAHPRALNIERELSNTGAKAGRAVVSGANVKEELLKLKEANLALQDELRQILINAGAAQDYLEPHFRCKSCMDKGYVDGRMCSCFASLLKETACDKLNRLSPLSLSSFDTFSLDYYSDKKEESGVSPKKLMSQIFDFCKQYARSFRPDSDSLVFCGATGLGKTHLALAIGNEVIRAGFGVVYCSAPDIAQKLEKEHFSRTPGADEGTQQALLDCDLLILDDLGTEFITQFTTGAVYNLFNSRLTAGKPTIISTNLSLKEMEKTYSQRFVSRVTGNCQRLSFIGADVRVLIKKKQIESKNGRN